MKVKIKSFDNAVKSAIKQNHDNDVLLVEEGYGRFDSIYEVPRLWGGWGNIIDILRCYSINNISVYDGEYYIPTYCIEEIVDEQNS